jgi:hypothetical protein
MVCSLLFLLSAPVWGLPSMMRWVNSVALSVWQFWAQRCHSHIGKTLKKQSPLRVLRPSNYQHQHSMLRGSHWRLHRSKRANYPMVLAMCSGR